MRGLTHAKVYSLADTFDARSQSSHSSPLALIAGYIEGPERREVENIVWINSDEGGMD